MRRNGTSGSSLLLLILGRLQQFRPGHELAQIDPANVREELVKAQQAPEYVPRALQRFIANLSDPNPIKNFIKNALPNRLSLP